MTLDDLTRQLAGLYRAGRPYAFLRQAQVVLARVPCVPELAALTLRALVDLGYGAAARAWIEARRDLTRDAAKSAELRTALAGLPDGVVPWSALRDHLDANLATLRRHRPELLTVVGDPAELIRDVRLHRSRYGDWHPAGPAEDLPHAWLMPMTTREDEAGINLPERGQVPVPMIAGLRVGALVDGLRARTAELFLTYSHPLYLIEPDLRRFAIWLHLRDQADWLADPRVQLFVGPDALARCADLLESATSLPLPALFVNLTETPELTADMRAAVSRATKGRNVRTLQAQARLAADYAPYDVGYWAEHLCPPGPVLAITSRFTTVLQYTARDALAALRRMGYATHLLIEQEDHAQLTQLAVAEAIERYQPALILLIDHLRPEHAVIPDTVPLLCWIQDPLPNLMNAQAGASIGPVDFVCGILKQRCVAQYGYPADQFVSLEMPVSLDVFHDGPVEPQAQADQACDVCFVSNASTPIATLHEVALRQQPAALHPLLRRLFECVQETLRRREFPYDAAVEMTRSAAEACGLQLDPDQLHHLASFHTYRLLDWGRRQETLAWVADWAQRTGRRLRIYGNGWEAHPTLAAYAAGPVAHGEPLRQALASARIALQLIPSGIRHQRTFEALACGALPLIRYCERDFARLPIAEYVRRRDAGIPVDGETLFPRLERIAFETPEQFASLAEHYLADESARGAVVSELRAVVLRHCTFDAAMQKAVTAFQGHLRRLARSDSRVDHGQAEPVRATLALGTARGSRGAG